MTQTEAHGNLALNTDPAKGISGQPRFHCLFLLNCIPKSLYLNKIFLAAAPDIFGKLMKVMDSLSRKNNAHLNTNTHSYTHNFANDVRVSGGTHPWTPD